MDAILLEKLLQEIKLANDGATTEQEFCLMVCQFADKIERIKLGIDKMPDDWKVG